MVTPKRWIVPSVVLACLAGFLSQADATGILDNGGTNPFAYFDGSTTWQGERHVTQNVSGLYTVDANLYYSVFAPGDFQNFLDSNSISYTYVDPEPIKGPKYIYAYLVEVISATQFTAPSGAGMFTVGGLGTQVLVDTAPSYVPGTGDEAPSLTSYQGSTSYLWDFAGALNGGEFSDILFFASPQTPYFEYAQVNVGIASGRTNPTDLPEGGVPSPLPEPTTVSLTLLLGMGLLARRRQ